MTSRRHFVLLLPATLVATAADARRGVVRMPPVSEHPTPRPGITAAKVLTKDQLGEYADAAPTFDMVRQIPQIIDGIRCQCGCATIETNYSLLSCFEGTGMAGHCQVCQGEAKLAFRLNKDGKSLDEIRTAIVAKFG